MKAQITGFPRIGSQRELKYALESYWKGESDGIALQATAIKLRHQNWRSQQHAGLDMVTVGDFSLYDHVLDTAIMLGAIPDRFKIDAETVSLKSYFQFARGNTKADIPAMEMTKWFDTNYHYLVPEFSAEMTLKRGSDKIVAETREALAAGFKPKPVLLGPVSFLQLGKTTNSFDRWSLLEPMLDIYESILRELAPLVEIIQIDEPILCTDLPEEAINAFEKAYKRIHAACAPAKLMLGTGFGSLNANLPLAVALPADILHLDLVGGAGQLSDIWDVLPEEKIISLGLIDGRNIWKTNADQAIHTAKSAINKVGRKRVWIGSSCSLLHVPVDLTQETELEQEIKSWLAFAVQKCEEITQIKNALNDEPDEAWLNANREAMESRRKHPLTFKQEVRSRVAQVKTDMLQRAAPFEERQVAQKKWLTLPAFPTTTIGSFPQTAEIRQARRRFRSGELSENQYRQIMQTAIEQVITFQDKLGLDVLVHGEPERADMVEYFGQQLEGFGFTRFGWVQSYGSRCVKPPIIYGDVSRPVSMTVDWINYAQQQTTKPVKGMLTGPVTILCWSFVRNDLPREKVCQQIALAIRDEVQDLEKNGVRIIQIDEAALREGMPLWQHETEEYLRWAVECFRLTASGVKNETQIHTHMCYSEFNAIAEAIAQMDADVISIEASRSKMELLDAFKEFNYPNDIGPGIWDIHSPRIPSALEIMLLLKQALKVIPKERLWVNPDCGLKTRAWPETRASLENMMIATRHLRGTCA